jgi:diguanylate cyclase
MYLFLEHNTLDTACYNNLKGGNAQVEFFYIFSIIFSISVQALLFVNAHRHRSVAGAKPLMVQIAFIIIWSLGSLLQMQLADKTGIMLWRNIQQIGIYGVPATCVYFAVEYGNFHKWKKFLPLLIIVPVLALIMVYTGNSDNMMQFGKEVGQRAPQGPRIHDKMVPVTAIFSAYNYSLVLISLILLGIVASKVTRKLRTQVIFIMLAMAIVYVFAFIQTAVNKPALMNIPVTVFFLPSSLILFYNLFRYDMMIASPIARDKVFDVIEQGILVSDASGTIVDENPYAEYILKTFFSIDTQLLGKGMKATFTDFPQWAELACGNEPGDMEIQAAPVGTNTHYFRIRVYPLQSGKSGSVGTVSIVRDITVRRLQESALRAKADMDGLTGLLNRGGFLGAFKTLLDEAQEACETVTVLMMDIDKFKHINDTYGHLDGDRVIAHLAEVLRSVLRSQDAISRLGGDEFAAVLPRIASAEAFKIAERIRAKAASQSILLEDGRTVSITLSIGIADNHSSNEADELLDYADKAMYMAKKASRNCCMVWQAE